MHQLAQMVSYSIANVGVFECDLLRLVYAKSARSDA